MMHFDLSRRAQAFAGVLGLVSLAAAAITCHAQSGPPSLVIPVVFTHTLEAGKVKPGETVSAKTLQVVSLPGGRIVPQQSTLIGHIVVSRSFAFDPTPYTVQEASVLSICFDKIAARGSSIPVKLSLRALADASEANQAREIHFVNEADWAGMRTLVGGDHSSGTGMQIESADGQIVGYNRKNGAVGPLVSNDYTSNYSSFHCDGSETEQPLAIFSPSVCGFYGSGATYISGNGMKSDGVITLESRRETVKLYGGSAALLQMIGPEAGM
jgi:hypothetical protein